MEDSVGDILPKLDFGVIFRSRFDDWFSDCQNGFGEGEQNILYKVVFFNLRYSNLDPLYHLL